MYFVLPVSNYLNVKWIFKSLRLNSPKSTRLTISYLLNSRCNDTNESFQMSSMKWII